jgi:hypothetical protein
MTIQDYIYDLICIELENAELNHDRHRQSFEGVVQDMDDQYGDSGQTYREVLTRSADRITKAHLTKNWIKGGGEI